MCVCTCGVSLSMSHKFVYLCMNETEQVEVVNCQIFFHFSNASLGRNMAPGPPLREMKAKRD